MHRVHLLGWFCLQSIGMCTGGTAAHGGRRRRRGRRPRRRGTLGAAAAEPWRQPRGGLNAERRRRLARSLAALHSVSRARTATSSWAVCGAGRRRRWEKRREGGATIGRPWGPADVKFKFNGHGKPASADPAAGSTTVQVGRLITQGLSLSHSIQVGHNEPPGAVAKKLRI